MKLKEKHIVITGGTSGIGHELVRQLSPQNKVSVLARCTEKLDRLKQECPTIVPYHVNLADLPSLEQTSRRLVDEHQHVDVLINNAAQQHPAHFLSPAFDYSTIEAEVTVNFTAACCLIHLLMPALLKAERAIILNVNSGLAITPKASSAVYCGTKAALNIFSQSLSYQLVNTNISVLQGFVPLVDTAMTHGRGRGKIAPKLAAKHLVKGLEKEIPENNIGKIKLLRLLQRFLPSVAREIMKTA